MRITKDIMMIAMMTMATMTACGPHEHASLSHPLDCFDGCSATYKEHVDKYRGRTGPAGETGRTGPAGASGSNGKDGRDGADGATCQAITIPDGTQVTCGHDVVVILNGRDGVNGTDGQDGADAQLELIDLCGNGKEFLIRLPDGRILAHFVQDSNQYFSVLGAGTYRSTDGMNCTFTVDADNQIYY